MFDLTQKIKKNISTIIIIAGALFIIAALALLFYNQRSYDIDTQKALASIHGLLPEVTDEFPQEKGNNVMPSMAIDSESYVAIICMEAYDYEMPVRSVYDAKAVEKVPCRYSGSIYDSSLVIATSDNDGQMDFINNVNTGDKITVTDMKGGRFTYKVVKVENSNSADEDELSEGGYDLTLLVEYSGYTDYLFIRCETAALG